MSFLPVQQLVPDGIPSSLFVNCATELAPLLLFLLTHFHLVLYPIFLNVLHLILSFFHLFIHIRCIITVYFEITVNTVNIN